MRRITIVGFLVLVPLFGCAPMKPTSSSAPPQVAKSTDSTVASTLPVQPPSAIQPTPAAPAHHPEVAKAKPPSANKPVKISAPVERTTPLAKQAVVAATPEKAPASPTLDLASLEQRLRDTHAIGVFTKLSLKNQVDDLLDQFRAFYRGQIKTTLSELRQQYDLLLMKVLTLLQDSDSALAAAILSSREAIWGILKDPKKFAQI
jgi:hypothetical protein